MRVMIVDDELPIREWIRMMIQKVDETLEVVACEASGEEAYQSFVSYRPELIISDIKMGNMDGIELLRKVKELDATTYFVLLTSHNDFNYARDGIRYGASEYILKTEITVESLAKIIENYNQSTMRSTQVKKKEYIEEVFSYEDGKGHTEKTGNVGETYFAISYRSELEGAEQMFAFSEKIQEVGDYYDREDRRYYIFKGEPSISEVSQYNEAFNVAKNFASVYNMKVGFSGACYQIQTAIQKAKIGLALSFYQEECGVSSFTQGETQDLMEKISLLRQNCIREIYNDNLEKAVKILDEILRAAKTNKYHCIDKLKNVLSDILHAYKLSLLNLGQASVCELIEHTQNLVVRSESYVEVYREIHIAFSYREDTLSEAGQYSLYTKKAIIFIQENYKENISLIDIVEKLNLNSEYFCRIFKKETGKTFLTYLTDYKIKKAQELLIKSEYSIQEISDKLGYTSVAYFSRVFKNKTGENPYKYRSQ